MVAEARAPLAQAERARAEAEQLPERRRSEYQPALAHYRQVERDAEAAVGSLLETRGGDRRRNSVRTEAQITPLRAVSSTGGDN